MEEMKNVVPVAESQGTKMKSNYSFDVKEYINLFIGLFKDPSGTKKKLDGKYSDIKEAGILGGVVSVSMMIIGLLMSMIGAIINRTLTGVNIDFANLKNIKYLDLIFKDLIFYALIILIIAAVFFVGAKIINKEIDFGKLIAYISVAIVPVYMAKVFAVPFLSLLSLKLIGTSIVVFLISGVYSINVLYEYINSTLLLEGNKKIFFNVLVYAVLIIIVAIFIRITIGNMLISGIAGLSSLGNMTDLGL